MMMPWSRVLDVSGQSRYGWFPSVFQSIAFGIECRCIMI